MNNKIANSNKMAKPIKETPVLTGKDAEQFIFKMEINKSRKVDRQQVMSMRSNAEKLKAILRHQ